MSAGAGLQADLKTFSALSVYGATVVSAVTAQNTLGVTAAHVLPPEIITAQIDAAFSDLCVAAVKTGMLGDEGAVEAAASGLERWARGIPIIVDPVMVSTTGSRLLEAGAEKAPIARLLFPARLPAHAKPGMRPRRLLGQPTARSEDEVKTQAQRLIALGPAAVLIKGGHGEASEATDILFDGETFHSYSARRSKRPTPTAPAARSLPPSRPFS